LNAADLLNQPPLLQVRAMSKRYEARAVLEGVTFGIRRGEIVSLVGPSGCGKSTLLRVLAGLDRDFEGEILRFFFCSRGWPTRARRRASA
jgi:sulfonate transport system ATP-binding protein